MDTDNANTESYVVSGRVKDILGPYHLSGHIGKQFIVFGFISPNEKAMNKVNNCVFYLDTSHARAPLLACKIASSLIEPSKTISVAFKSPPFWNGIADPSYIISDVL